MKDKIKYLYIVIIIALIICTVIFLYKRYSEDNTLNIDELIGSDEVAVIDEDDSINWDSLDSEVISLSNKSVTITSGGVYTLSGKINNGSLIVDTEDNVKLILNNVEITNESGPAIIILQAKNAIIELASDSVNTLTDGSTYNNQEYDGCIYSKDDLILQGTGKLIVNANYLDGIVSKDDLKIVSGTYIVNSNDDGIRGKDSVYIVDGNITINSKSDGIKATNDTDSDKGSILIDGGTFDINCVNDAIQAENKLVINGGKFNIKTTGKSSVDSSKGLKANVLLSITGGVFNISSNDDCIHSNGNIVITKGEFTITSSDDAIHADGLIEINGGTFNITASEGIEATYVRINNGVINIKATDDGINAGNKSNAYSVAVEINGGTITITMGQGDTDGIDSNGNLYINGGTIDITCNSPFDYDGESKYTGGTIIVNGETTNKITNQMMGGGPMGGNMPNGNQGARPGRR